MAEFYGIGIHRPAGWNPWNLRVRMDDDYPNLEVSLFSSIHFFFLRETLRAILFLFLVLGNYSFNKVMDSLQVYLHSNSLLNEEK